MGTKNFSSACTATRARHPADKGVPSLRRPQDHRRRKRPSSATAESRRHAWAPDSFRMGQDTRRRMRSLWDCTSVTATTAHTILPAAIPRPPP